MRSLAIPLLLLPSLARAELPPITDANSALLVLGMGGSNRIPGLEHLAKACTGSARRALRDEPRVLQRLAALSKTEDTPVKKKVMDTFRCFSPAKLVTLLEIQLADPDPKVVAYAAEVSARASDPAVVPVLLATLEAAQPGCAKEGLSAEALDRCVWLHYAPGASLEGAPKPLRERAGQLAAAGMESSYPKIREVSVETVAATKLKAFAPRIGALIAKEKKGGFSPANDAALLGRFASRQKVLARGE